MSARRAGALMAAGARAAKRGDAHAARGRFEEALELRRAAFGADDRRVADTLSALGTCLETLGFYAEARVRHEEALAAQSARLPPRDAAIGAGLHAIGRAAYRAGDLTGARRLMQEALTIRRERLGEEAPEVGATLNNLGAVCGDLGDYAGAQGFYAASLANKRRRLGEDHPEIALTLDNLGIVLRNLGRLEEAREHHQRAFDIALAAYGEDHGNVARPLLNLGVVHRDQGRPEAALAEFERALAIFRRLHGAEHVFVAAALLNLGAAHHDLGDYARVKDLNEQALAIRRASLGNAHPEVGNSLVNLGNLYDRLGDYPRAEACLDEGLATLEAALGPVHPSLAQAHINFGAVHYSRGEYERSGSHHEKALAIYRNLLGEDHHEVARARQNLGDIALRLGDVEKARSLYESAIASLRRNGGDGHPDLCQPLIGLADALIAADRLDDADSPLAEALQIATTPGGVNYVPRVYSVLAWLARARGDAVAAIFHWKQAVNALQRHRRLLSALPAELQRSFVETRERTWRDLADALVDAGRLGEAQQVLAMLKEDELFELLRDASAAGRMTYAELTALETEWRRHGDEVTADLVRLSEEVASLRARADRTPDDQERLAAARADLDTAGRSFREWLDGLRGDLAGRSGPDAQGAAVNLELLERLQGELRALGPGVALLSYVMGEEKLSIILTGPRLQISRDAPVSERAMNQLVHAFRRALDGRLEDEALELGQTLWRHLMGPVASVLDEMGTTTLMVVPYGTLRYVPMAALHDGERYAVERYAVSVLTLAAQGGLRDAPSADWRVAGFGVAREVPGYRRLLAVEEELTGIVRLGEQGAAGVYPGTIRLDEAFTEEALAEALEHHQAVHLASHFVLNPAQGFHSHLLLGDGSPLPLERLRDVSFDFHGVELMTLSACETAMGGGRENGREFEGFAALVQQRGAKAVIASLWPVSDSSTAALMRVFYAARRAGLSKAAALREAQLSLLSGPHAHPFHWAPFILMGNWL